MTRRLALLVALLAATAGAERAVADVRLPYVPVAGPAVWDGRLAWAEDAGSGAAPALELRVEGESSWRLGADVLAPDGVPADDYDEPGVLAGVALGAGAVALQSAVVGVTGGRSSTEHTVARAFAGRRGGGLVALGEGCPFETLPDIPNVAVNGTRVVQAQPRCQGAIDDLDGGARVPLPAGVTGVRWAGDWMAWVEGRYSQDPTVAVGRTDGSAEYRVASTQIGPGAFIQDFDIGGDGTLAVSYAQMGASTTRAAVAFPASPAPRRIPLDGVAALRVAAGQVIAVVSHATVAGEVPYGGSVLAYDLASGAVRTVAEGVDAGGSPARLDSDGRSLAVITRGCDEVRLRVVALAGPPARFRAPARCPLRLAGRISRDRYGSLRVALSCRGFERRCVAGAVRLTPLGRTRPTLAYGEQEKDGRYLLYPANEARRALRSPLRVRLSARIADRGGVERRARNVTLPPLTTAPGATP